jgi:hypothetical protein
MHNLVVAVTHLKIPLQETGAFNLFAWQLVWITGMALGAMSIQGPLPFVRLPRFVYPLCAAVCAFFIGVRHNWLGARLTTQTFGLMLDKWQIGPLRLVNLLAFVVLAYWFRRLIKLFVLREPFLTLGKASLEVFSAHLVFVFVGLALLYGEAEQLHGVAAALLVAVTFCGLILVAIREIRRKHREQKAAAEKKAMPETIPVLRPYV